MSSDLLAPAQHGKGITLVVTDWQGRMPEEVRSVLGAFIRAQGDSNGLRLTGLDLHGKVGWFIELLCERKHTFEAKDSWIQNLELSLVEEGLVDKLPRFGNLRTLRVYQPEFGSEPCLVELLRRNLHQLEEVACVASTAAAPFRAVVRELDQPPGPVDSWPPSLGEADRGCAPPTAGAAVEHARAEAGRREGCLLWLRGSQAHVTEALELLGQAIARNRRLVESEKTFIGRMGTLRLDLPDMPQSELEAFRAHAAQLLRDNRLGPDEKLDLRLQIELRGPLAAAKEEPVLMCLIDLAVLSIGIESVHGLFLPIIPRNSTVPMKRLVQVRWAEPGAFVPVAAAAPPHVAQAEDEAAAAPEGRTVRVFCGERAMAADNELVGEVEVRAGAGPVELSFDLDANETLWVNGARAAGPIGPALGRDRVRQHIERAEAAAGEDRARRHELLGAAGLTTAQFLTASYLYQRDRVGPLGDAGGTNAQDLGPLRPDSPQLSS